MFVKEDGNFTPITITLSKPEDNRDGFFSCCVEFNGAPEYHADIQGVDGINAIQCALAYIDGICLNSNEPKFYWDDVAE